jgi:hypothetical protein
VSFLVNPSSSLSALASETLLGLTTSTNSEFIRAIAHSRLDLADSLHVLHLVPVLSSVVKTAVPLPFFRTVLSELTEIPLWWEDDVPITAAILEFLFLFDLSAVVPTVLDDLRLLALAQVSVIILYFCGLCISLALTAPMWPSCIRCFSA